MSDNTLHRAPAAIRVNQLGFLPGAVKRAVLPDPVPLAFRVVNVETGETAFEGPLSAPIENPGAGETNRVADFTPLAAPGRYRVEAEGWRSPEFAVGEGVYDALFRASLKMLYLQRCGVALDAGFAGDYAHPACHCAPATLYGTDARLDVSGGWHDAGDYGRYIVSGAKTVADLLIAHEAFGARADDIGIPESGDGLDDLLQEAKFELDWMMKMQAPSGGVYHKVTCAGFPDFVMPEDETEPLVVCPVSNAATGDFAAVMAMAARLCAGIWPEDAARWRSAAERAWVYLEAHRGDPGFTNPPGIVTGEYPDAHDCDEYFWAAAELAKATGKPAYRAAAAEFMATGGKRRGMGWEDVGTYGLLAVLTDPALAAEDPLRLAARAELEATLADAVKLIDANPYGADRAMDYEWGSNMGVANTGALLLLGADLLGDDALRDRAQRSLDYLLGCNANGFCYVTGFGEVSPEHPHHRPSVARGRAMPGMLVGGPDNGLHDPEAVAHLTGAAPAKCYVDHFGSYSTNEICVYWNSPLSLLLAGLLRKADK